MLNFEESVRLAQLKEEFYKTVGLVHTIITDDQFKEIFRRINATPQAQRGLSTIQGIITQVIGRVKFLFEEALDFSDIDLIQKEIEDLLKKK